MNQNGPMEYLGSFAICFAAGMLTLQLWRWATSRAGQPPERPRLGKPGGVHHDT